MAATFETKTRTFEANQAVRKDEFEALSKAIEIISSPDVAGSYATHVNLVQGPLPSFLQLRGSPRHVAVRERAVEYLQGKAKSLSSRVLLSAAAELAGNPFEKVVAMVQ